MPLIKTKYKLNNLTDRLFDLVYADGQNEDAVKELLQASQLLCGKPATQDLAIDFAATVAVQMDNNIFWSEASCLDLSILQKKPRCFEILCKHFFSSAFANPTCLPFIYISAVCHSIATHQMEFLNALLSQLSFLPFNLNVNLASHWGVKGTSCPLNVAIATGNQQALRLLLLHDANPEFKDAKNHSALDLAKSLPTSKKPLQAMLICAVKLRQAKQAYQDKQAAKVTLYLAAALDTDSKFVELYIMEMAQRAISQLTNQHDVTDYRFLKEFIRVVAGIYFSPLNDKTTTHETFYLDSLQHLLGAYHCEAEVSESVHKLFLTTQEKIEFFTQPLTPHLLDKLNCDKTISAMQEKKYIPSDQSITNPNANMNGSASKKEASSETSLLAKSMTTSGILKEEKKQSNTNGATVTKAKVSLVRTPVSN